MCRQFCVTEQACTPGVPSPPPPFVCCKCPVRPCGRGHVVSAGIVFDVKIMGRGKGVRSLWWLSVLGRQIASSSKEFKVCIGVWDDKTLARQK